MKTKLLLLVFVIIFSNANLLATDFTVDGIAYTISSSVSPYTVSVRSKSPAYTGIVTIPGVVSYNSINYSVTSIGDNVFQNCSGLTSVTIGNSVLSIGDFAFDNCTGLNSVTIGNSVTSIGFHAFYGSSSLISVTIPNSLTTIGPGAFMYCAALFYVDTNNPNYSGSDGVLYNKSQTTLVQCPVSKTGSFVIPSSVTSIGSYSFNGCTGLTSVTIPNSVTAIGSNTFDGCTGLTTVAIPNSVTSIGYYIFNGCTGLTAVTIPNTVTSIGPYAFDNCSGLTFVNLPNSVTSIGHEAFWRCTGLTAATIPSSVTTIGYSAFAYCSGLTSIYTDSPTPVDLSSSSDVFNKVNKTNCTLYVPFGSKSLYAAADQWKDFTDIKERSTAGFTVDGIAYLITSSTSPKTVEVAYGGNYTGEVSIPASVSYNSISYSVTSIGNYAFDQCISLSSVTIPGSVTSIGSYAFYGCTGSTSITIPSSVTSIGKYAFTFNSCLFDVAGNNSNFSSVDGVLYDKDHTTLIQCPVSKTGNFEIPTSVTSIKDGAFASCSGLTSVSLPNSVTFIGDHAFESCVGLNSFTIPNSVTYIGNYAFYKCTGLTSVTITATAITLPNSVTLIGDYAFDKCTGLISLYANSPTPINLSLNSNSSYTGFNSDIILYVPTGSKSLYAAAPVWKDFKNIVERVVTGMAEPVSTTGNNAVWQNYPNPFTSTTTIKFKVTEPGFVSLKVFDALGTVVASLVNEKKPVGDYSIEWNAAGLPSGIYFCKLQNGEHSEVQKMLLLNYAGKTQGISKFLKSIVNLLL